MYTSGSVSGLTLSVGDRWVLAERLLARSAVAAVVAPAIAATALARGSAAIAAEGAATISAAVDVAAATPSLDAAAAAAAAAASASASALGSPDALAAAELAAAGVTSVVPPGYVPSPLEPGWEIWAGFVAGVVPFAIGAYEFGKRIIIQLRCEVCGGRGLVPSAGPGRDKYLRKCPQCGGFFPWISWKMFLSSTAAPGNGGPLQQPRGQTSVFYSVPARPDPAAQAETLARSQAAVDAAQALANRRRPVDGGSHVDGAAAVPAGEEAPKAEQKAG